MNKKNIAEFDMRDDFKFEVYVTTDIDNDEGICSIDQYESVPGVITKEGDFIKLELSHPFKASDDSSTLYAVTWEGTIAFTINNYVKMQENYNYSFNFIEPNFIEVYRIRDMYICSQFEMSDNINQVRFYLDYIHEWFSFYSPKLNIKELKEQDSLIKIENIKYKNQSFSFAVNGFYSAKVNPDNSKENLLFIDSNITIEFLTPQSKEFVLDLGNKIKNFFQFLLRKKIGIYKIIINKPLYNSVNDKSKNLFVSPSFLPKKSTFESYELKYSDFKEDFEKILKKFLIDKEIQDFVDRFIIGSLYDIHISSSLLTLSSAVETYLRNKKFSNGVVVQDFTKKLNMVFNGKWQSDEKTQDIVEKLKNNRDFYVHGIDCEKLNNEDLFKLIQIFSTAIWKYLKNEMKI